jgi:hypothetical protein
MDTFEDGKKKTSSGRKIVTRFKREERTVALE